MILKTQKGSEIPEGAVALSKKEALDYQWNFIKNWHSEFEVLSIKFGRHIVSASTFVSSIYITNFYRKLLNLNKTYFVIAFTPGIILTTFTSYIYTDQILTNSILLMKFNCPLCDQLKFAGCQFYTSLIFPASYGLINLIGFGSVTKSYPVPNIKTHAREFWKMSLDIIKMGTPYFQIVGLFQTILILCLPYLQNEQLHNIINKSENNIKNKSEQNEFKDNIELQSAF